MHYKIYGNTYFTEGNTFVQLYETGEILFFVGKHNGFLNKELDVGEANERLFLDKNIFDFYKNYLRFNLPTELNTIYDIQVITWNKITI